MISSSYLNQVGIKQYTRCDAIFVADFVVQFSKL